MSRASALARRWVRAFGPRRPDHDLGVHATALDASRRTVEPGKNSARAPRTARGVDEPGGRLHRHDPVPDGRTGNHLVRRRSLDRLDGEVRSTASALHWQNVYVRKPTPKEVLHRTPVLTQFGRMCERLGIKIIAASSSQARGRVERNHGTHQEYCDEHNRRFAIEPNLGVDYHLPAPGARKRREIWRPSGY